MIEVALTIGVVAFVAMVLLGHVLVLAALMSPAPDAATGAGKAEALVKPARLGFRLTAS